MIYHVFQHIEKTETCWLWTAAKDKHGYGRTDPANGSSLAHKVVYETLAAIVPEGFELDHTCNNPSCVNPTHLEVVTHEENMRRHREREGIGIRCVGGHLYTPSNTYVNPRTGKKRCRACRIGEYRRYNGGK